MSADHRKVFLEAIKATLTPILREDGFTGSGSTFRRMRDPFFHIINIQGSQDGGRCCINLGLHLPILAKSFGQPPDLKTMTEPECEFRTRLAPEGQAEFWWPYGETEDQALASAKSIQELYERVGRAAYARFESFPGPFDMSLEDFQSGGNPAKPFRSTNILLTLAMSRIALHQGKAEKAKAFAQYGLSLLKRHSAGFATEFEAILKTA